MQKGATTVHNTGNSCHPRFSNANISRRQKGQLTSGLALKVGYVSCCLSTLTASQLSKTIRNSVFDRFLVKNVTASFFNEIARRRMLNWAMGDGMYARLWLYFLSFTTATPRGTRPRPRVFVRLPSFSPGQVDAQSRRRRGGRAGPGGPPSLREPE